MKLSAVIIVISVFISIALTALMYLKREDEAAIAKKASIMDIKVRVTRDVMGEYRVEAEKLQKSLEEGTKLVEQLNAAIQTDQNEDKTKNDELAACQTELEKIKDDTTAAQKEIETGKGQHDQESSGRAKEIADLKQQLEQKSKVCDFVKKDSADGLKLCGMPVPEPPKQAEKEAPKPEAPKEEAPKAEAPKEEAPKPEAPKAGASKEEAPKAEAPKAEAPKAEAPKAEAPKAEVPKAEAPKEKLK